jgi:hypothetical protein
LKPDPSIPANELYSQFVQKCPSEVIVYRRGDKDFPIRIKVLTHAKAEQCTIRATEYFKKRGLDKDERAPMWTDRVACEILNEACREVDLQLTSDGKQEIDHPFFRHGATGISEELTLDELAQLFELYKQVQYRLGPMEKDVSQNELEAWINRLADGVSPNFLIRWDYYQLAELATMLAVKCHGLLTQQKDSAYFLKYLSNNSDTGITSLTEGQSEQSTSEEPNERVEFGATSAGLSKAFPNEHSEKSLPPKMKLNTKEETQALAAILRSQNAEYNRRKP